ncbi:MAG: LdpA C-terminal domain-containing domain [Cyanobacteria bacterium P01_A01_bin.84]
MTDLKQAPLLSLVESRWFKLIGGASFHYLPALRSLAIAYTLAGADCIDVAADPAVVNAVRNALDIVPSLTDEARQRGFGFCKKNTLPLLMISLNDGEDPHFRKASFDYTSCPINCQRPCEQICPTQAIVFEQSVNGKDCEGYQHQKVSSGVIEQKCYGCGRCIPICPYDKIYTSAYVSTPGAIAPLVLSMGVDAVEVHTRVGRFTDFQRLWQSISPWLDRLQLLAISCPGEEGVIEYLRTLYDLIAPLPCPLIWQADGRPMSGDIGDGTTLATVKLGQKFLAAKLPGYVQLAGGTNKYTVAKLKAMGLLGSHKQADIPIQDRGDERTHLPNSPYISGVAYGSYARTLLSPVLQQLEVKEVSNPHVQANVRLENEVDLLWQAVKLAHSLVSQIKSQ